MSTGFQAIQWNRKKIIYDGILLAAIVAYLSAFILVESWLTPPKNLADVVDLRVIAFGSCAFFLLSFILCIGPLTRLDRRFLPLLYNRRHLGVVTFCVAALHAWYMVDWYLVRDALPSLGRELTNWVHYRQFIGFPFKVLGAGALLIMFLMAATSHDFWLAFLTPRVWKGLHMALYFAYGLVVMHVALGAMQGGGAVIPIILIVVFGTVVTLHLWAGWRERSTDRGSAVNDDGWISVSRPEEIPDKGACIVAAHGGERIAIFRDGNWIGALANLCAHQGGPVGEGRIIDGLVTCPWHGFQYSLKDGCAPPPFTEKLATYRVRIKDGMVEVDPQQLRPGTQAGIKCSLATGKNPESTTTSERRSRSAPPTHET
jgi:nitrite reductase/ring-hydroxylating ferredoxin subunit/DMSO/TMAO reductase YedYZ heme-binding membrane subunit